MNTSLGSPKCTMREKPIWKMQNKSMKVLGLRFVSIFKGSNRKEKDQTLGNQLASRFERFPRKKNFFVNRNKRGKTTHRRKTYLWIEYIDAIKQIQKVLHFYAHKLWIILTIFLPQIESRCSLRETIYSCFYPQEVKTMILKQRKITDKWSFWYEYIE